MGNSEIYAAILTPVIIFGVFMYFYLNDNKK